MFETIKDIFVVVGRHFVSIRRSTYFSYCKCDLPLSHKQKQRIWLHENRKERGIPAHQYFWWKRKYSSQEVPEGFLPVSGGVLPSAMPTHNSGASSKVKSRSDTTGENWMSIELRTAGGTDMRIQGGLTPAMVYTILKSL